MIISISGTIASGKTTIGKKISEKFNFSYLSVGDIMRNMATNRKVSLTEFSKIAENDFEIDKKIDLIQKENVKKLIEEKKSCVVDGRISWHILKEFNVNLKIFLNAPLEIRAKRFSERENCSYEKAIEEIKIRESSEIKRFKEIYNIDVNDINNYDIYLNVEKWDIEGVSEILNKAIENLIKK
ncbi:MAG: (d)CMP kinase [Candidatus Altarchaeaceae archaeon]